MSSVPCTLKTYASRAESHSNPTAKRLLGIMERKKSNLCVSVDVTTCEEVLEVVRRVGKSVCMVKVSEESRERMYAEYMADLKGEGNDWRGYRWTTSSLTLIFRFLYKYS